MADWSVRHLRRALSCGVLLLCCFAGRVAAQEMQPRAYIPAPIGLNFFSFGYANNSGDMLFDPGLPVEDAKVKADVFTMAFGQSLGVLGRTAQALVVVPYVVANLDGLYVGSQTHLYRSGIGDVALRYAMNIYGAPAMRGKQLASYKQKTIVGASITVSAPTGQYDPARLINIGSNRWAFKPEIGVSRAFGKWSVEGAGGVWLYTENHHFNGSAVRTQVPMGSLQLHVLRFLPHRIWLACDGTFFTGARSTVNGVDRSDYIGNQRWGGTFGYALNRRQAIKVTYFDGVLTRVGGDIRSIGISYNFIWQRGQ